MIEIHPLTLATLVLAALGATITNLYLWQKLDRASHDAAFRCLTRAGLERIFRAGSDVIFLDLDRIGDLNEILGYPVVNEKVARALAAATRRGEVVAGRWFSGDELVVLCPPGVGDYVAERLRLALAAEGLSACMAVTPCAAALLPAVDAAAADVQAQKRARDAALERAA